MYKVIKINRHMATTFIDVLNLDTQTIDGCFDDSAVVSDENFDFMEEGELYNCKIELFGDFDREPTEKSVVIRILADDVLIGDQTSLKVAIGDDIYYIPKSAAEGFEIRETMLFHYTRKDLIQVNDTVHADCFYD